MHGESASFFCRSEHGFSEPCRSEHGFNFICVLLFDLQMQMQLFSKFSASKLCCEIFFIVVSVFRSETTDDAGEEGAIESCRTGDSHS